MCEVLYARGKQSENLIQTCIFGLGVLAERHNAMLPDRQFEVERVLEAVQWVYSQNLKTEDGTERAECEDNAVGALAKCVYFHGERVPSSVITPGLLDKLPLTTDTEEA